MGWTCRWEGMLMFHSAVEAKEDIFQIGLFLPDFWWGWSYCAAEGSFLTEEYRFLVKLSRRRAHGGPLAAPPWHCITNVGNACVAYFVSCFLFQCCTTASTCRAYTTRALDHTSGTPPVIECRVFQRLDIWHPTTDPWKRCRDRGALSWTTLLILFITFISSNFHIIKTVMNTLCSSLYLNQQTHLIYSVPFFF